MSVGSGRAAWLLLGHWDLLGEVRMLSMEELQACVADPKLAVARVVELLQTLRSESEEMRAWAADALQQIECLPAANLGAIGPLCMDSYPVVANWACKMTSRIAGARSGAEETLLRTLTLHPHVEVRQQAAKGLGHMGALHPSTLAAMQTLLERGIDQTDARLARCIRRALQPQPTTPPGPCAP
ncbi:MAG: hypothetical protein D6753_05070 [Planctomycetota bacterium]|nr:MAG: hypothetical protein D6753_05070 [Planctomycetota bacterium]